MVWLWILLGILLIFLALGLAGFETACVRRELPPQALTEEYLRGTSRAKWAEEFVFPPTGSTRRSRRRCAS